MKVLKIGLIFFILLMLVGCNNTVTNSQADIYSPAMQQPDQTGNTSSPSTGIQSTDTANYEKTYEETSEEYYEVDNQEIQCADSFTTYVKSTVFYTYNEPGRAEYDIAQGRDGGRFTAELTRDEEYQYHFTLKNEKGEDLLALSTYGEFNDVIKFTDVNMDGYADIQFCGEPGTLNNGYVLYVWDDTIGNFVKVNYNGMLSYFEVHDGYLQVWEKNDAYSGVVEKLAWKDKHTLIKVSEESYYVDLGNNLDEILNNGFKMFEDQSFSIEFENFGEVRFVSGGIEEANPFELKLFLTDKDGNLIYSLPDFYGNQWPMLTELSAVAFKDVNKDGLKDVIVIAHYMTGVGQNGAEDFPVAGVYFQKGKGFTDITEIDKQINEKNRNESIDAVIKFVNSIDLSKYDF